MTKQLNYNFLSLFVGILLCSLPFQAVGQPPASQPQNATPGTTQAKPLSLPHLYWHFLVYVNFLDTKAAELQAQGKDGSRMRNDLQLRTQLSDEDFSAVRASSQRLSTEIKAFDAKATEAHAGGYSPATAGLLKNLVNQREVAINTEIANLTQTLSPQKKAALDQFLREFFAPRNAVQKQPTMHPTPAGVK